MKTDKQRLERVTRRQILKILGPIAITGNAVAVGSMSSLSREPDSATSLTKNVPVRGGKVEDGIPLNCQQFALFRALENHAPLAAYASKTNKRVEG
jgi:hypothetical protein